MQRGSKAPSIAKRSSLSSAQVNTHTHTHINPAINWLVLDAADYTGTINAAGGGREGGIGRDMLPERLLSNMPPRELPPLCLLSFWSKEVMVSCLFGSLFLWSLWHQVLADMTPCVKSPKDVLT
jgi:hypothetical protein